ncbi:uncharacterized protein LOC131011179 [Salvia miltiorrhiza]|uniref:uncharacterized protein LOC131011179 n=1 Tax=Salvia miltiorrhiza TaxID=226208 RepID=UPI0025AD47E9|nr:uncharacterized protein LOC131011179 [Salvia miltiorrhiza]
MPLHSYFNSSNSYNADFIIELTCREQSLQGKIVKSESQNPCASSLRNSNSSECARQRFALGLAMLVGMVHSIKLESLLKLITTLLEVSSSMKGVRRLKTAY